MTGEEIAGPPAPKLVRLLYFVGAACKFDRFSLKDLIFDTKFESLLHFFDDFFF